MRRRLQPAPEILMALSMAGEKGVRSIVMKLKPRRPEMTTDLVSKMDTLEMRIAHQDRTINELNDIVTEQWRKIEMLERKIAQVLEEVQNLDSARSVEDKPPPHY
jgi:SlyX protein